MLKGILLVFLVLHLLFGAIAQFYIVKTGILSSKLKVFHSVLIWIIPFCWSILFIGNYRTKGIEIMTRDERNRQSNNNSDNLVDLTGGDQPHT
jgi:hypothetical protein